MKERIAGLSWIETEIVKGSFSRSLAAGRLYATIELKMTI